MTSKEAHREALSRRFTKSFRAAGFSAEELDLISRHGAWLESLATGQIQPISAAQRHFLEVASGRADPQSIHERVWLKLQTARAKPPVAVTQPKSVDNSTEESQQTKPDAEQIIRLAREGKLTSLQLRQVVDRSSEFGFTKDQISELQNQIQKNAAGTSKTWSTCTYCQGDGGPGGRCHHCGGNGFEP